MHSVRNEEWNMATDDDGVVADFERDHFELAIPSPPSFIWPFITLARALLCLFGAFFAIRKLYVDL